MDLTPTLDRDEPFRFEYEPAVLRYGHDCVAGLAAELDEHDCDSALVVCGTTVGETPEVIDPVLDGLGDQCAGVFAETTPEKRLGTAYDGLERFRETAADVLVSLGGGSSLDVAKLISILAATDRDPTAVGEEFVRTGTITVPDEGLAPIVAIPTTLAGADLSMSAGVTADPSTCPVDESISGGVTGPSLMPAAVCYDPSLVATTPRAILAASAMNGFDKGIETLYAKTATPITDATAIRGLSLLKDGLLAFGAGEDDPSVYAALTQGIMLVQYGISQPGVSTLSLIHAFGHGLTRTDDVQQGAAHAIVAPHVLEYLFDNVDGRRELLAEALTDGDPDDPADSIVATVEAVVDALDLPTRLRDVDGPDRSEFSAVADVVLADSLMPNAPADLEPSKADLEAILDAAW